MNSINRTEDRLTIEGIIIIVFILLINVLFDKHLFQGGLVNSICNFVSVIGISYIITSISGFFFSFFSFKCSIVKLLLGISLAVIGTGILSYTDPEIDRSNKNNRDKIELRDGNSLNSQWFIVINYKEKPSCKDSITSNLIKEDNILIKGNIKTAKETERLYERIYTNQHPNRIVVSVSRSLPF